MSLSMQEVILRLTQFWAEEGCVLMQPYNTEVGAGTLNPATFLRVLGPEPWRTVYVEPSVRPDDSRYGDNPNRLQTHTQLQVILKPDPGCSQDLYLKSLAAIGIDAKVHDLRFVEDNWESPALGAWGLGWEVWLDGLEITQFTYFQQAGQLQLDPVSVEITYGLERIVMALQDVTHFKQIRYTDEITYGEIFGQAEREMSVYYLDEADVDTIRELFSTYEAEARRLIELRLPVPAHNYVLRCSHAFNVLDARGAVGTSERARAFQIMRTLSHEVADLWTASRRELEYPLGIGTVGTHHPLSSHDQPPTTPQTFVLEIGFEELPAAQVTSYAEQIEKLVSAALEEQRLSFDRVCAFGSPRRIIVQVDALAPEQLATSDWVKGPRRSAAYQPDGEPTKAAVGFARKHGLEVAALSEREIDGDVFVGVTKEHPGRSTVDVLAEHLPTVLSSLHASRNMRWSAGPTASASRPIRWIVALFGEAAVPFTYAGLDAGRRTQGLRTSHPPAIELTTAVKLLPRLMEAGVVYDSADRRRQVLDGAERLAATVAGRIDPDDDTVVDEVTNLIENPQPILGSFDGEYLRLPPEILTTVMKKHQRYLPVRSGDGALLPFFVTVANGPVDEGAVRAGNEAVLRARFADAGFFFDRDRESTLESFRSALAKITFEEKVGSMLDRADRVERLANALGEQHLASADDREVLRRAAHLLHADLATSLVIELPALSGRVGRWYAQKDGEHAEVAQLVFEATLPRSADGELPTSKAAALLAVADRADVLVALFIAGSRPTGSADPQGLRRAATGLLQILLAHDLDLDLEVLFRDAAEPLEAPLRADTLDALMAFVSTRLEGRLADEGHSVEDVRALQRWHRQPVALAGRLAELEALRKGAEFEVVVAAYRRVLQLSKDAPTTEFDPTLSREPTEQALWAAFASVEPVLEAIPSLRRFVDVFGSLVDPIDAFFADVMIMAKDEAVRTNRLALLARIAASGAGQLRWDLLPSVR